MNNKKKQEVIDDSVINSLNAVGLALSGNPAALKNLEYVIDTSITLQTELGAEMESKTKNRKPTTKYTQEDAQLVRDLWSKQDKKRQSDKLRAVIRAFELKNKGKNAPTESTILRWIKEK